MLTKLASLTYSDETGGIQVHAVCDQQHNWYHTLTPAETALLSSDPLLLDAQMTIAAKAACPVPATPKVPLQVRAKQNLDLQAAIDKAK